MIKQLLATLWNKQLSVIFKDDTKRVEYMDSIIALLRVLCLASRSTYNMVDRLWTPMDAL